MKNSTCMFALSALLALPAIPAYAESFESASIILERNVTDDDAEVVIFAKGGDGGLVRLSVLAPDGTAVADFSAPGDEALGLREFLLESPEPGIETIQSAYPQGRYTMIGVTAGGEELRADISFSHEMPAATGPTITARDGTGLVVSWEPVKSATRYLLEIENDELGFTVQATLPGSVSSLDVPRSWLVPGMEYELGLATVNEAGNVSFAESEFEAE